MSEKRRPESWLSKIAIDCFDQISTTNNKVKSTACSPHGLYPVIDQGQNYISGYINDESKLIKITTPICIFGDHTRIIKWVEHNFAPGADGTKLLKPKGFIYPRYAYYSLCALNIPDKGYSRHFKYFKELNIDIPAWEEQKIIAEKLDTLLAQVDSTKARLEQIPQILKRFRQAVLGAAMNGTLMGLKESRPHPLCKQWQWSEVPSTWSVLTYSELVDSRLGKMLDKVKNIGSPIKYLGNVNVRWFSFNLENLQDILISESERSELILKYGDILICEGGEPGRCAIWTESDKTPIVFQKALHRARVREKIIPEWLVLNLKNDSNNLTLSQLFTGTTIKHLTGKALAKYPLRVPPVYEQREIVRRVEQLFAYADAIEKQVSNALARVNNLTQSILAKAFRGELTAQWRAENPELISGENSAAALLEKIKAERAASGGKKASRKKS